MGEKLGTPVTLKVGGRVRNRVNMVGIELEGGWTKLPRGCRVIRDGSVLFNRPGDTPISDLKGVGEVPSAPLMMDEWEKWLRLYYPQHVNETCGMHVHLSFKNALAYSRTMDSSYPATILAYVTEWAKREKLDAAHPLWPRLEGKSEYCQHIYDADIQILKTSKEYDHHREGHRYTVVNYSWGRHNTVECRLLPMMATADVAVSAIQEVINITNSYLAATAKRSGRLEGAVEGDGEPDIEVRRVHI